MKNNKTRLHLMIFLLLLSAITDITAQSLQDNPHYLQSLILKKQSEEAFEMGNYTESIELAKESANYAKLSDEWIEMMLNKYRANSALNRVERRYQSALKMKGETNFPEVMLEGKKLYDMASNLYSEGEYTESYPIALKAYETFQQIKYIKSITILPAAYLVKDIPGDEDCLWKIAEYDFIFGDALQWKHIYEANRDILPQIDNPDLIIAGLVLQIPSINGEKRAGTWVDGSIQ